MRARKNNMNKNSFCLLALLTLVAHHQQNIASSPAPTEQTPSSEKQRPRFNFSGLAGSVKKLSMQSTVPNNDQQNSNVVTFKSISSAMDAPPEVIKPSRLRTVSLEDAGNRPTSTSQISSCFSPASSSLTPLSFAQSSGRLSSKTPLSQTASTPRRGSISYLNQDDYRCFSVESEEDEQPALPLTRASSPYPHLDSKQQDQNITNQQPSLPPTPEPCPPSSPDLIQATSIQFCFQAQRNPDITDAQWINTQARLGKLFRDMKNPLIDSTGYQAFAQYVPAPSVDEYKEQFKQAIKATANEKEVSFRSELNLFPNSRSNTPIASINSDGSTAPQTSCDTVALDFHVHKRSNSATWNHLLNLYVHTSDLPNALAETLKAQARKEIACEATVAYYDHETNETTKR